MPRYRILRPEDEAEVERLYQRLKTVGNLDQKNSTDENEFVVARPSFLLKSALALLFLGAVVYLSRDVWLSAFGKALVHDDGAGKADVAGGLAGDYWGHRLTTGAEPARQGNLPPALVRGPPGLYG